MNNLKIAIITRRIHRLIKLFLLVVLSFLFIITACNKPITQNTNISTLEKETPSDCRVIKHRRGEACVPLEPKRIVALDVPAILDPLIALDIKPLGTVVDSFGDGQDWSGNRYFPALLPELVEGIEIVGVEPTPSVEKILKLKPDLILLANQFESSYEQLSKIAKIVGKQKQGEEVLARYQERISKFNERLGKRLVNSEISVLGYYQNQLYISANWASYFQVFRDIGLKIKPILLKKKEFSNISIETVSDFDADIMFFIEFNSPSKPLLQNPLIQSLSAVKNNRAYFVDATVWEFYGPIGMNLFLDDLSKYLLEGK